MPDFGPIRIGKVFDSNGEQPIVGGVATVTGPYIRVHGTDGTTKVAGFIRPRMSSVTVGGAVDNAPGGVLNNFTVEWLNYPYSGNGHTLKVHKLGDEVLCDTLTLNVNNPPPPPPPSAGPDPIDTDALASMRSLPVIAPAAGQADAFTLLQPEALESGRLLSSRTMLIVVRCRKNRIPVARATAFRLDEALACQGGTVVSRYVDKSATPNFRITTFLFSMPPKATHALVDVRSAKNARVRSMWIIGFETGVEAC